MAEGGGEGKRRVYVARKDPQVHRTSPLKAPWAEAISEAEAKKRHLGSVRTILYLDRQTADVLSTAFKSVVAELR